MVYQTIQPSLLAFDQQEMKRQLFACAKVGIKVIHFDVMDGQFVANKSFDFSVLDNLIPMQLKASVHLMTKNVLTYVKTYLTHPVVESIFIHVDADLPTKVLAALDLINQTKQVQAGIALKNTIPITSAISLFLKKCQQVLMMGVPPGKGGQPYMPITNFKLAQLKTFLTVHQIPAAIILDGGVNCEVIKMTNHLVDHYVIGSFLMQNGDFDQKYQEITNTLRKIT